MTYLVARAGYDFVRLRFIPIGTPGKPKYLPQDNAMLRHTKAALADTGLKMLDVELAASLPVSILRATCRPWKPPPSWAPATSYRAPGLPTGPIAISWSIVLGSYAIWPNRWV
jgi:hypothetical protein